MFNIHLRMRTVPEFLRALPSEEEGNVDYVSAFILYKGNTLIEAIVEPEYVKYISHAGQSKKRYEHINIKFLFVIHTNNVYPSDETPIEILDKAAEYWFRYIDYAKASYPSEGLDVES